MRICLSRAAAVLASFFVLALWPTTGLAAPRVAHTFAALQREVVTGDKLTVFPRSSASIAGRLVTLTPSEVTVETADGSRTFREADVARIDCRRRGPVWNGFVIGTAVVAVPAVIIDGSVSTAGRLSDDIPGILALSAIWGGGIGVLIDALKAGDVKVYESQSKPDKEFALIPLVSATRKGVAFAVRF